MLENDMIQLPMIGSDTAQLPMIGSDVAQFPMIESDMTQLAMIGWPPTVTPLLPAPQYPTVYISPAGLLTVLLQMDVIVEMTGDKTIRIVNHKWKSVVATTGRGNASCIHHIAAKLYQVSNFTARIIFFFFIYGRQDIVSSSLYCLTNTYSHYF